jgi:hypothetical protein
MHLIGVLYLSERNNKAPILICFTTDTEFVYCAVRTEIVSLILVSLNIDIGAWVSVVYKVLRY